MITVLLDVGISTYTFKYIMRRKVVIAENRVSTKTSTHISVRIFLISPPFRRMRPHKPCVYFYCILPIAYIKHVWLIFKHEPRRTTQLVYNTYVK